MTPSAADVNAKHRDGVTTLMFAAAKGYTEIVEILITNGGDVNARDKDSWSALTFAIKYNHTEINRLLEQAGAEFFVPYNI